jgi:hypothetical protein
MNGAHSRVIRQQEFEVWLRPDFLGWTDHELTATESGRLLPTVPARGNHDRPGRARFSRARCRP